MIRLAKNEIRFSSIRKKNRVLFCFQTFLLLPNNRPNTDFDFCACFYREKRKENEYCSKKLKWKQLLFTFKSTIHCSPLSGIIDNKKHVTFAKKHLQPNRYLRIQESRRWISTSVEYVRYRSTADQATLKILRKKTETISKSDRLSTIKVNNSRTSSIAWIASFEYRPVAEQRSALWFDRDESWQAAR